MLVDNDSWILPYAIKLVAELQAQDLDAWLVRESQNIDEVWINFMLGCTKIVSPEILKKNRHNLVVHESNLPEGRGLAPMTWQIIEGKNKIPVCLVEAADEVDSGLIWIKDEIKLHGTELSGEWRALQGNKTIELCKKFIYSYGQLTPTEQTGQGNWYSKRSWEDSELDPDKTLAEQFALLRVVDNDAYPAFFNYKGRSYKLTIEPMDLV